MFLDDETTHHTKSSTTTSGGSPVVGLSEETTTANAQTGGGGAYGDPHLKTWSGKACDFHGACDLVLVQSVQSDLDLHIRTTMHDDWSYITATALATMFWRLTARPFTI